MVSERKDNLVLDFVSKNTNKELKLFATCLQLFDYRVSKAAYSTVSRMWKVIIKKIHESTHEINSPSLNANS